MDETLSNVADLVKNFAVIYVVDISKVPDFNSMYELYDPCTVMFFYRNKHIMIDLGTGNNNKIDWAIEDPQELIDLIETVFRGASKGRGLPALPGKVTECLKGSKTASQFKNRALQVAYYIDKADPLGQVLLQEPRIKDEDEVEGHDEDSESPATNKGLFTYKALRPARNVLVLVPEPFDANNDVLIPSMLNVDIG
ncbi:Thioredoxin-like 4A [Coemansia sp. S2]|nr:Thioredoxin-like 4A [Coemansia sp. S2]